MRLYYLVSFIVCLLLALVWTGAIIYLAVNSKLSAMGFRVVLLFGGVIFFLWGAREMYQSFKAAGPED
jgi:hypothetical protein